MIYRKYIKRILDVLSAHVALILFCWLYGLIALLVRINFGKPVLFSQLRPGQKDSSGRENIFLIYKFRTMTNDRDENGELLPDEQRLTKFGKWLRSTSLDEIPEVINILHGDMSVVGPRPQLVKDMVFMTPEQRTRHDVKPGLTGLAQVSGRNALLWDNKLEKDIEYNENISFLFDIKIFFRTIKCFIKSEGITQDNMATAEDYGDYLLRTGKVTKEEYDAKQEEAKRYVHTICG